MMRSGLVGVEQQMFVLRDTNSPDGDPRRATAFIDGLMEHGRALKLLRSLLAIPVTFGGALERPPSDPTRTRQVTYKYARRLLPAIALANGEKLEDTNEIGAWLAALSDCVGAYCSAGTWRGVASTVVANTTGRDVGACLRASRIAETTPRPPCGGNAVAPLDRNAARTESTVRSMINGTLAAVPSVPYSEAH